MVVVLACDAPLVDRALIEDLLRVAAANDSAAMAHQGGYWQPMFSVLPRRLLPVLEQAWAEGERSLQKALLRAKVQARVQCRRSPLEQLQRAAAGIRATSLIAGPAQRPHRSLRLPLVARTAPSPVHQAKRMTDHPHDGDIP